MSDSRNQSLNKQSAAARQPSALQSITKRVAIIAVALIFALTTLTPAALSTGTAFAEEPSTYAESSFAYRHNPIYNPTAMEDVVVNPNAVYGFSPNPDSGSLKEYATYDWTDPEVVAQAHETRLAYHQQMLQMFNIVEDMTAQGASTEEIARAVSTQRNQIRWDSYKDDPEGLERLKKRNLEKYGNEFGPTPESLYEKNGSWEAVLLSAFSSNPGMDACCGLYDEGWDLYVYFGQIPLHTVSFDAAGHGEAPGTQSVYAGETAAQPEGPTEEGWTFEGWFAEGSEEPFDFSAPIAADTTLVAAWSKNPDPKPADAEPTDADTPTDQPEAASNNTPAATSSRKNSTLPATGDASAQTLVSTLCATGLMCHWGGTLLARRRRR